MKTLFLALGFSLVLWAPARADLILVNRDSVSAFFQVFFVDGSQLRPFVCQVPAQSSFLVPTDNWQVALAEVYVFAESRSFSRNFSDAPLEVSGLTSIVFRNTGEIVVHVGPAAEGETAAYWDWWFKGFGLGIGFCALGAFVRMIRAAKGATSLEL